MPSHSIVGSLRACGVAEIEEVGISSHLVPLGPFGNSWLQNAEAPRQTDLCIGRQALPTKYQNLELREGSSELFSIWLSHSVQIHALNLAPEGAQRNHGELEFRVLKRHHNSNTVCFIAQLRATLPDTFGSAAASVVHTARPTM